MKRFNRYSCLLLTSLSLFAIFVQAQANPMQSNQRQLNNEITIINHFDKPLQFKIGVNPEILPDFPIKFMIAANNQMSSKVIDTKKETYIHTEVNQGKSGYWGVDVENNKTHIHGYLSKGIAYSWKTETIIFCTPEEYKKHGFCI